MYVQYTVGDNMDEHYSTNDMMQSDAVIFNAVEKMGRKGVFFVAVV